MRNRIKFFVACLLWVPLVLVGAAALADRFENPQLTETQLFDRWAPYVAITAVPAFGGYVLAAYTLDDESEEE